MQTSFSSCSAFYVAFLPLSSVWRGHAGREEKRDRGVVGERYRERKRQRETE